MLILVIANSITLIYLIKEHNVIDTITGVGIFFTIQLLAPSNSSPYQFSQQNSYHSYLRYRALKITEKAKVIFIFWLLNS